MPVLLLAPREDRTYFFSLSVDKLTGMDVGDLVAKEKALPAVLQWYHNSSRGFKNGGNFFLVANLVTSKGSPPPTK